MIKITKFPGVIRYYSRNYLNIFNNRPQYNHFKRYLTGLMVCENKTLTAIQSKFLKSSSPNSLDHFMIRSEWSEKDLNKQRILSLERNPETTSNPKGVICIDDTLNHKTGKHMDDAEWHFDHALRKMVLGHNIVSSQYKDHRLNYPLDYRLYHRKPIIKELKKAYSKIERQLDLFTPKQYLIEKLKLLVNFKKRLVRFKTKIELAIELIHEAESLGIKAKTYVFDSWFLCNQTAQVIRSYGKDWTSVLKSNRVLIIANQRVNLSEFIENIPRQAFQRIKTKRGRNYWVFTKSVRVSCLGKVRIVISYDNPLFKGDPLVLATNRKDWESLKILNTYEMRWGIESFYRDAKQHLGLEDYQIRNIKGIKRHWYFVFLAHSFLMLNAMNSKFVKRLRANISTIGQSSREMADEITMSLILWIYKNFQDRKGIEGVVQCLLS